MKEHHGGMNLAVLLKVSIHLPSEPHILQTSEVTRLTRNGPLVGIITPCHGLIILTHLRDITCTGEPCTLRRLI